MPTYETVLVAYSHNQRIATVTMNRGEVHNAFNSQLVNDLKAAFSALNKDENLSAVILTGAGKSFSAGADLNMMQSAARYSEEENRQEARQMGGLFDLVNNCHVPIVARVNGTAMGGGLGLIAACDIVIAAETARLSFSEVKLGIVPAVISPIVISKIGSSWARRLFITGERFTPALAREIGLVHTVVPLAELDAAVEDMVQELLSSAPRAMRVCKTLAKTVGQMAPIEARNFTAETIARLRVSDEGQEGLKAFLEKRKPGWMPAKEE